MKSAIRSPNLEICFWLIRRPLRPLAVQLPPLCAARKLVSGSPSGQPPAPKRRKRARGRLSQKLWPSPGKLSREARRASPQRQNNGARVSDGAGLPWLSQASAVARKVVSGSPTGQLPAPKLRKRARATRPSQAVAEASTVAEKVFLGRAFGQPDGPDPSPNLQ